MQEVTLTKLYEAILANTAALEAHTAALSNADGVKPEPAKAEIVEPETNAPETDVEAEQNDDGVTIRDVETALLEVKNKFGAEAAKALLKDVAGVSSVKKMELVKYDEFIAACEAKMKEEVKADEPEAEVETDDVGETSTESKHTLEDVQAAAKKLGGISRNHLEKAKKSSLM